MDLLNDLTEVTGRYRGLDGPFGKLRNTVISKDGTEYYIIFHKEFEYQSFYAINEAIALRWNWFSSAMASGMPFCEWKMNNGVIWLNEFHSFEYENQGIGTLLMKEFLDYAVENDCIEIRGKLSRVDVKGDVVKQNKRRHFYEKFGFDVEEDEQGNGFISMKL